MRLILISFGRIIQSCVLFSTSTAPVVQLRQTNSPSRIISSTPAVTSGQLQSSVPRSNLSWIWRICWLLVSYLELKLNWDHYCLSFIITYYAFAFIMSRIM